MCRMVVGKPLPAGGWYLAKSALLVGFFHFSSFSVGAGLGTPRNSSIVVVVWSNYDSIVVVVTLAFISK